MAALHDLGLNDLLESRPTTLSAGQRRLVGIARAVAASPSILLLDEPAAGLDENETRELGEVVVHLARQWGMGIAIVEHDFSLVQAICDRLVVLDHGTILAEGATAEVTKREDVVAAFIGPTHKAVVTEPKAAAVQSRVMSAILEARGLTVGYGTLAVARELNLSVEPGRVMLILGPNGAGKTTTLMTLAGALRPLTGRGSTGRRTRDHPLHRRVQQGLAFVPDERGAITRLTVDENLRLGPGDPVRAFELFPELRDHRKRRAGLLSGGQQKMLALALALSGRAEGAAGR